MSDQMEKQYLYWLCQIDGVGAVSIRKLYERYGSFEMVYNIEESQLVTDEFLPCTMIKRLIAAKNKFSECVESYHRLAKQGIQFITPFDPEYPQCLVTLHDYPMGLYVKGRLPDQNRPTAAIIGARNCSSYGKQVAEYMGNILSQEGVQIISGLASGIDGAGHRGALKKGGETYAILGNGVNICYPKEHYHIYQQIIETGGVISEFPLDASPKPFHFPMRNRLISGFSDLIIVIEAKEKSGSLITVEYGLEQGKEIFALPGRITDVLSSGCNQLIQLGANILLSPLDIIEYFGIKYEKILKVKEKTINCLAKKEKIVYSCLDLEPKCLEQIITLTGLSVSECMSVLLELELGGYVDRTAGNYYGKKL